jgi:hypothetical protein
VVVVVVLRGVLEILVVQVVALAVITLPAEQEHAVKVIVAVRVTVSLADYQPVVAVVQGL